jgi:glucose-6-phosphate-specific signal transduction histidine kinase
MVPQSLDKTEITIRQKVANDLHEVFQRLRTLAARAKETGSFGNSTDRQDLLLLMEEELKDIVRETKRVIVPFLIDEGRRIESDFHLRFLQDLNKLFNRYSSQSRKITLQHDLKVVRRLSPVQCWGMHKIIEICLGNAAEHAKASQIDLFLQEDSSQPDVWIELQIKYDGAGDPRLNDLDTLAKQVYPNHKGIFRMCEERDKLSAKSQVVSCADCTTFTFKIPISK